MGPNCTLRLKRMDDPHMRASIRDWCCQAESMGRREKLTCPVDEESRLFVQPELARRLLTDQRGANLTACV